MIFLLEGSQPLARMRTKDSMKNPSLSCLQETDWGPLTCLFAKFTCVESHHNYFEITLLHF